MKVSTSSTSQSLIPLLNLLVLDEHIQHVRIFAFVSKVKQVESGYMFRQSAVQNCKRTAFCEATALNSI